MKKKVVRRFFALLLATQLAATAIPVYADPFVAGNNNDEVESASVVDDAAALEEADNAAGSSELADPQTAASYLLENGQDEVLKQVPTDEHDTSLPETFDLRDQGVVTPVKSQNPFGTCWGFSVIAASETSILSEMGKTYEETGLDLSEHHLAYFTRTYLQDGSSQDGEGVHMIEEAEDSDTLNTGGTAFTAVSVLSTGIGPVDESLIPYRGTESKTDSALSVTKGFNLSSIGVLNYEYSEEDDWTIPSEYEFLTSYELEEANSLPSPAVYDEEVLNNLDGNLDLITTEEAREAAYIGYDASATDIWKQQLMEGKAISVAFSADTSMPGQSTDDGVAMYLNTSGDQWLHYTFDGGLANHAVTIVGWDDTIPASSFLDHSSDLYGDGEAHLPEGDGAWIVKNSWGASTGSFPNGGALSGWGNKDEDGKQDGYFYISYYDRSLCYAETFDYDIEGSDNDAYMIDQYDYMQSDETAGWADENGLQMANIFTAEDDGLLTAVSCQTNSANVSTTYQVYLLSDDATLPDDGELAATLTADYEYAGFHKTNLDTPVSISKGQRYSVVVTSCFQAGDQRYYEFSTGVGNSKEAVENYNHRIIYRNRGVSADNYKDQLILYYSEGVVNAGESFVYMNALGQWGDMAEIIPYLQQNEDYQDDTFDNFPVKAYLEFTDSAQAAASATVLPELDYADEVGQINVVHLVLNLLIILAVLGVIAMNIMGFVKIVDSGQRIKKLKWQLGNMEKEVNTLRAQIPQAPENTEDK